MATVGTAILAGWGLALLLMPALPSPQEAWRMAGVQLPQSSGAEEGNAGGIAAALGGLPPESEAVPASAPAAGKKAEPKSGSPPSALPEDAGKIVFTADDPAGDDNGPGTYTYPQDAAFTPRGLWDLRNFTVRQGAGKVTFLLKFGAVTNPWGAPEGFFHQRVDIYIDTTPGLGETRPARAGANVMFDPAYAWDVLVRVAPWGGSGLYKAEAGHGGAGAEGTASSSTTGGAGAAVRKVLGCTPEGVRAGALQDGQTVAVQVPLAAIGAPQRNWRYYVLVGGYDGFGPDQYRLVMKAPGPWFFGGGDDGNADPNVVDLLAPGGGKYSQKAQLGSFKVAENRQAVIHPINCPEVEAENGRGGLWRWLPFGRSL